MQLLLLSGSPITFQSAVLEREHRIIFCEKTVKGFYTSVVAEDA